MNLVDCVLECRPALCDVDMTKVVAGNISDPQDVKGRIAETFVGDWLLGCEGITIRRDIGGTTKGYTLKQSERGSITVMRSQECFCEYDLVIAYQERLTLVEVKALKLNGFPGRIRRNLEVACDIFGEDDMEMLLFFPAYSNKRKDAVRIEREWLQVHCIDSGYKKKQMMRMVEKYYAARIFTGK